MGPLKPDALPFQKKAKRVVKASPRKKVTPTLHDQADSGEESPQTNVMSVSEVTRRVALLLEEGIGEVWIEGEISNYRCQSSGHHYFTLKDSASQIPCVLFARSAGAALSGLQLRDGLAVQIFGSVTVYQPRGQYQLMVRLVQAKGEGALQAKFEALKKKLAAEGLFETGRKRLLPRFPQRIGVVTSPTGAAIADFLQVLHRRHPGLHVVINPVRVQGKGAAREIADAIMEFSRSDTTIGVVDVIVVTRGGGSLEDLWEFNEEIVARAIAASPIPVVSAIGHEIDFTICDFVADIRVPTPSAAAELIAADGEALLEKLNSLVMQIAREVMTQRTIALRRMDHLERSLLFREPERLLLQMGQTLDRLQESLQSEVKHYLQKISLTMGAAAAALRGSHPGHFVFQARQRYLSLQHQLDHQVKHRNDLLRARVERLHASFTVLNPEATLARGFTITRNGAGDVITSLKQVHKGALLRTQFCDGVVTSIEADDTLEVKREKNKKPWY